MEETKQFKPPPGENIDSDPRKALLTSSPQLPWVTQMAARVFPAGFGPEAKRTWALAWPACLSQLFSYIMGPVSLIFCGHLGREELDGVALAVSLRNITGLTVANGMCTACDTLFSQAFGGSNRRLVGVYLQRSLLVIPLSCLVCWSIHLNGEGILLLLGQNPRVARICGEYLLHFMPGLMCSFLYQVLTKYLQNQNYVMVPVVIGGIGNALNALVQYVAVYGLDFGTNGSAVAEGLSYFIMCLCTLGFIVGSRMYRDTWSGWSWKALENWGMFLRLAIPGVVMLGMELWTFEIGIFLNGLLGEAELGATSVTFHLEGIIFMIPLGISVACSIRVGQNLGAGDADAAKTASRVAQAIAWLVFLVVGVFLLSLRNVLPLVFTNDSEVAALVSKSLLLIAFIQFLDSITAPSMGTLRGCGRQLSGAICNFIGYFVVTLPLAVVLMFVVKIGMMGFWFGLAIGITPICVAYMVMMVRMDWDREVIKAQKRATETGRRKPVNEESSLISKYSAMGEPTTDPVGLSVNGTGPVHGAESLDTSPSTRHKRCLLVKRLLAAVGVVAVLLTGVLIRLYVPLPRVASDLATSSSTQNSTEFPGSGATAAWTTT